MLATDSGRWANFFNFCVEIGLESPDSEDLGGPDPDAEWQEIEWEFRREIYDNRNALKTTLPVQTRKESA